MTSTSRLTSLIGLFGPRDTDTREIERIEIPVFQRDYAQGRTTAAVNDIRANFLDVLFRALSGESPEPVSLDFVYGELDSGTLRPLDGQQRLTTLFLLHWYLASRAGLLEADHRWKQFSYATRPSARLFCKRLVDSPLPAADSSPSDWIVDQPWYLYVWRHDPTIQSMLVMIDAIDDRFKSVDAETAWARLTDDDEPAIAFLLLSLTEMGSVEDLYIKMNSRGKPLTEFETFKAHFERTIESSDRADEFALKVDTTWSDLLWEMRGDDDLIDDEFLRYVQFVMEICEWRDGRTDVPTSRLDDRARDIFGDGNPNRKQHLEFLFSSFDVWTDHSIAAAFADVFTDVAGDMTNIAKVRLFFRSERTGQSQVNLFDACCRSYGESRGKARVFSLGQSLILYATLLHLIEGTEQFQRRVRVLRNIIEASTDELRPDRMDKIISDVHAIIRHGSVEQVSTLNKAQVDDELRKQAFLEANPGLQDALFSLEDHEILRGSLGAFEFDPAKLETRASSFQRLMSQPELWPDLTAALLAVGQYQRQRTNSRPFLFGTNSKKQENAWRELLTGAPFEKLSQTRQVLMELLDSVADAHGATLQDALKQITSRFLEERELERRFDWRYYMVKYPSMREGGGTYFAERFDVEEQASMGYSLCMLRGGTTALNAWYRDPYLLAIWRELEADSRIEDPWFTGYEKLPRSLQLNRSGTGLRCVPAGYELSVPLVEEQYDAFKSVVLDLGSDQEKVLPVSQEEVDGELIDSADRIQLGANIVRRLLAAGL
ncbi:MAG: DUF262 domain-containing protein [Actinomycetota bacterium]